VNTNRSCRGVFEDFEKDNTLYEYIKQYAVAVYNDYNDPSGYGVLRLNHTFINDNRANSDFDKYDACLFDTDN